MLRERGGHPFLTTGFRHVDSVVDEWGGLLPTGNIFEHRHEDSQGVMDQRSTTWL